MAAPGDSTINAGIDFDVNVKDLDAQLRSIVTKFGNDLAKVLTKFTAGMSKGVGGMGKGLNSESKAIVDSLKAVTKSLAAVEATNAAMQKSFGKSFDPSNTLAYNDALRKLVQLQQQLDDGIGDPEQIKQQTKAIIAGLVSTRNALREVTASQRQDTRVKMQDSKSYTSRYVVDAQSQASAARDASRESVEATKAASRQRVATIQAAARTIATIERGLSTVFKGTANAIGSAFRGIGTAASGVANGISGAFRKANSQVINNTSSISNAYSTSFRSATNSVRNETRQQASVINNFAREAKASISSIGTVGSGAGFGLGAAIGGILGVGAAKALSGGFTRAANLQDAEKALTFLLNSKERAIALQGEILKIVEGTPFALDQFATATTQLLSFGIEAEKIPGFLQAIGDVAILSSSQTTTIDSLVRVFGQISAAGRLTGEDLNQLSEASVPALKILGNTFGVTTGEMRDMVSDGAVPAAEALEALRNGILNGTDGINGATQAFAGLSKELGTGLRGSVANFFTAINRLGAGIFIAFEKPFTAALAAATAAVDLLGSAIKILAVNIQNSVAFQVIQKGLEGMTTALKNAKKELAPFFDFISGGIVILGQMAAGLFLLKRIPGALTAIGSAIKFILAPQRLLIAGAVLIASYFKKLYDESAGLRTALGEVGAAIGRIATVVKDLAVDAFEALTGGAKEAGEGVSTLAYDVLDVVVPALQKLSTFLLEKVLPPIRNFAKRVREDVLPAVGGFLATALERGQEAFRNFVDFIKDEVIPVVGPILKRAFEIARSAITGLVEFVTAAFNIITKGGTTLKSDGWLSSDGPVVKGLFKIRELVKDLKERLVDIRPILLGVGVALGALALTGGNIPLAGLAGLTAGLVAALSNDDVRNALIDNFNTAIATIKEKLGNLFSGDTLKKIGVGVLKAANKIGKVIGDVLSDPRIYAVAGGIALAGAAVAAAFVAGLAEGIIKNIPVIATALSNAFKAAIGFVISDPAIALAFVGAFFGTVAIAKLITSARTTGRVLAQALQQGAVTASTTGAGSGPSGLLNGLFGGSAAVQRAGEQTGQKFGKSLGTAIGNQIRVIEKLGGNVPALMQGPDISAIDRTNRLARSQKDLTKEVGRLEGNLGKAAVSGVRLRDGLGQVTSGKFRQGFSQLSTAVQSAGKELGASAGIIAGAAFAASFVSQALFDVNASGKDKIQSALGTIAIGAAAGQQIGQGKGALIGAGLGVAVAGIGLLTTSLKKNTVQADEAAAKVDRYAEALKGASVIELPNVFEDLVGSALEGADTKVLEDLKRVGFEYEAFAEAVRTGNVKEEFGDILRFVELTSGQLGNLKIPPGSDPSLTRDLIEMEVSGKRTNEVLEFLQVEILALEAAASRSDLMGALFGENGEVANAGARVGQAITENMALAAVEIEAADAAAQAFNDTVNELNETRINGFRDRLNEAKAELDGLEQKADDAKQAVIDALAGPPEAETLGGAIDNTVANLDDLRETIMGIDLNPLFNPSGPGEMRRALEDVQLQIADLLSESPDYKGAEAIAAQIKAAFTGVEGGDVVIAEADAALANWNPDLAAAKAKVDSQVKNAKTKVSTRETLLGNALSTDPATIASIVEEARGAAETAAQGVIDGFTGKFEGNTEMQDALKTQGEAAIKDFLASLGTASPSTITAQAGADVAQGFVNGLGAATAQMQSAGRFAGIAAMQGLTAGIQQGGAQAVDAARAIALRVAQAIRDALKIKSPSKVTEEIGEQTVEGFIVGVEDSLPLIDRIAFSAGTYIADKFKDVGRRAGQAIGIGFAEEGGGFAGSVAGALDEAFVEALSRTDQFKLIGQAITQAMFAGQGENAFGIVGGGSAETGLQQAFLSILGNSSGFSEKIQAQFDEVIGKDANDKDIVRGAAGFTLDITNPIGRENRQAFLEAGANIREYAGDLLAAGRSIESVIFEATHFRDALLATAAAFGLPQSTLDELVNTLGLADSQLASFVDSVNATTEASRRSAVEAEKAMAAQKEAEAAAKAREEAEKKAEDAEREREKAEEEAKRAAEEAERAREKAQQEAEKAAEDLKRAKDEAEEEKRRLAQEADERARREYTFRQPVFRDLIVQSPSGDPEAVALAAANKVAFSVRR